MIVKICGITNLDDAMMALDAGADWIGLNLVAGPRKISLDTVRSILRGLPDPNQVVALIMLDESSDQTDAFNTLRLSGVRRVQLYGHTSQEQIATLHEDGFETICVHSISGAECVAELNEWLSTYSVKKPEFLLLDASDPYQLGGTGRLANWEAIVQAHSAGATEHWPPVILAGGLTPDNVAEAIQTVHLAGVDVSSGVESSPGKKDRAKVFAFVHAAKTATTR
jgi:phosphoribosylanthranilate isomerase